MQARTNEIPNRYFAHPFDKRLRDFDEGTHGVGRSNEAIGGYFGVGWYEHFQDRETGETYQVRCSDGINGGKDSHSDQDERWISECYRSILTRTRAEASQDASDVRLSRNEWVLMQGRMHAGWLDPQEGEEYAQQADCSIEEGLIGHILGVPVIVDPDKKDELPSH